MNMLRVAFLVVILVLLLSFFGVSLQHLVESPASQANFGYVGDLLSHGWNDLLTFLNGLRDSILNLF